MYRAIAVGVAAVAAVMLLLGQGARPAEAATTLFVTNNNNSGTGSFRAAVEQANANPNVGTIKFLVSGPINLQNAVVYTNTQPLTLSALARTVIQGAANWPFTVSCEATGDASASCLPPCDDAGLFTSTSAADLTILSLTFQNATCGSGIRVQLPDEDRTTTITLNAVMLRNNDVAGLWVTDDDGSCDSGDNAITLNVSASSATGNGEDGVKVREYGPGGVNASVSFSTFSNNGNEGLDLTEHCEGDLVLTALAGNFNNNGSGNDGLFLEESEGGGLTASLNGVTANGNGDDGVSISERDELDDASAALRATDNEEDDAASASGPGVASCGIGGTLTLTVTGGRANGNASDGFDIDEAGCGELNATFNAVAASWNDDDGIELDEEDGGDLHFAAGSATTTEHNGQNEESGDGIDVDERGYGNLTVDVTSIVTRFNGIAGDDVFNDGMELDEEDEGDVTLTVRFSMIAGNADDGVFIDENGCGNLDATFASSTVSANADDGIDAEQDDCGSDTGELTLVFTSVVANGDNNLELDGVAQN